MFSPKTIKYILTTTGIAIGLFLLPFVLSIFSPFVLAFIVAVPCQRIVRFLDVKIHISRGISSALIATFIVALMITIVAIIVFQLYLQAKNLISVLPVAADVLKGQLGGLTAQLNGYKHTLPVELSAWIDNLIISFKNYSSDLSQRITTSAISTAGNLATQLPKIFLFIAMFILGTFFFTKDFLLVKNFFKELLPPKVFDIFRRTKGFLMVAFSSYLKAQFILMFLTAALVTVSFWIVGIDFPLLWGLISGIVDALPFLGTAAVLVPMALFSLMIGDNYSFMAILIIQVLVFVVRQLAEPKVVSRQIGVHPILTLISVYVGLRFFGFAGVVLAPIILVLLVNLYVSYKETSANKHFR